MAVPTPQLISLQRSAAMLRRGQKHPVDRDVLHDLCEELIAARRLLDRLGHDLRTVARRGGTTDEPGDRRDERPAP